MEENTSKSEEATHLVDGTPVAATEPIKKVEKVVTGEVIMRKKPLGSKFKEMFLGSDAKSTGRFVLETVFIPAVKELLSKAVSEGFDRMLYGESQSQRYRTSTRPSGPSGFTSYNRPSVGGSPPWAPDPRDNRRDLSRQARATHDFRGCLYDTRGEADHVLERMYDLLSQFGRVSVADLYDLSGITGSHVDFKWGWTDLGGTRILRERGKYFLDLPSTENLN